MATTARKFPYIWVSWLTGILAGSQQCEWKLWFACHFKYDKRADDFDLAAWTADHDRLVLARQGEFEVDGWQVRRENQNWTRIRGSSAELVGKMDLVADQGGQFVVADGKTG